MFIQISYSLFRRYANIFKNLFIGSCVEFIEQW